MADKPAAEKTQYPTFRKLQKARQKGQVPQSQELMSVAALLVLVAMITLMGPGLTNWFIVQIKHGMSCENVVFSNTEAFMAFVNGKTTDLILVILPIVAALFVGSVLAGAAISGLNFAPGAIDLKFDALNPVTGFEKLIDARSLVKLLTSILKLLCISLVVWFYIRSRLEVFGTLRWSWSMQMLAGMAKLILGLLIRIGVVLLIIGVADALYQKWKYIQDLKMTRQEAKQDRKDTEGSQELKGRIRRIQIEMASRRMLREVPKASVVLVNPTHVAVALRYEPGQMEAPMMVAKGADHLAEKIREIARAYGVPIVSRPELARTIYSAVEPGNPIPEALYVAVAEVLGMIYRLRGRR
ncbi:MAG: EscU/YscU/HrcU family type III secretion system export apparatus switch protein [Planctomycetota bacterium]|jgi:flagellar biosynthetic protein FlhB